MCCLLSLMCRGSVIILVKKRRKGKLWGEFIVFVLDVDMGTTDSF